MPWLPCKNCLHERNKSLLHLGSSLVQMPSNFETCWVGNSYLSRQSRQQQTFIAADLTGLLLQTPDQLGKMCLSGDLVGALEVRSSISCRKSIGETDRLQILTARSGPGPDLSWRSQPLGHTYADLLVIGYTGRAELGGHKENYIKLLNILLSAGVPRDNTDFSGKTALHHAAKASRSADLINVLLKYKPNVDPQDRFGASPLLIAIQEDAVDVIPVLLDAGASLDVTDGEGSSPRSAYFTRPVEVSNVVKNWLIRHKGKGAAVEGDRCSKCGSGSASMKRCSRCRSQLYCSPECQSEFLPASVIPPTYVISLGPSRGLERAQKGLSTIRQGRKSPRCEARVHVW